MRILFLSHYFPPEVNAPASRTFEHCRQWVRDGHQVTVVTCAPNHPRGQIYRGYQNHGLFREERDGISVIRLWTYITANEGFIKRTVNYVSFMVACIVTLPALPTADVVITTSPQFFNGLAGYFVSRAKRIPWVLEIRDLWPDSILAVGAIRNRCIIRLLEYLELFAYRKADRIVPVTDAFKRHMEAKGIPSEKIIVIKNGVDLAFYTTPAGDNPLRAKLGLSGKFVAGYFGTHGMAHKLEVILDAAERLRTDPKVVFLLVGDGAERERLLKLRDDRRLTNVIMLDQLPKEDMPNLWDVCDVSLVLLRRSDLFKTVIPSKIFESMGMSRPIILGVEGESTEIITVARAGFCIEPENVKQLAEKISLLANNPKLGRELGSNGRTYVTQYFDRTVLARRFLALLQSLVSTNR